MLFFWLNTILKGSLGDVNEQNLNLVLLKFGQ